MTSDNQKSVNQLVHEVVDLVATATNAVAIAHAEARSAEALAAAMDGGSASLGARARRIAMATCAARINSESAQDALQRLERRLAQTVSKPKQSDDGWIEWSGGDCPVPRETIVKVRYRDELGPEPSGNTRDWFMADRADAWRWSHMGNQHDIVAYRVHKPATLAEAQAEIARLRAEVETQKREHEGLREWSADQADQILELIDAHNEAAAQYNEAQAECEALKRENAERKLSELQAAHEALQQAHQDAVQQLASRNNELANLRKFIS